MVHCHKNRMGYLAALLGPMENSEGEVQEQEEWRIAAAKAEGRNVPHARQYYAVMEAAAAVGGGVLVEGEIHVDVRFAQKLMPRGAVGG